MKIIITIIALSTSLILAQQKDSVMHYNMGEIEIKATMGNKLNTIEVDQKEIQNWNAFSAFDAVQFSSGFYTSVSGKNEAQLSIRGFDQRQISVMIDGAPVYIPYDGSFDLNAIQLAGFNKISISKNTPSILYGPNSMGGSINLVSENSVKPLSARLTYQNGSSQNLSLGLNGRFSNFYWNAAFGLSESYGFKLPNNFFLTENEDGDKRENSSYKAKSGLIKIGTRLFENLNLAFAFNYIDNQRDVPVNVYTKRPRYWRYSEWNKALANIMFNSAISSSVTLKGNIFYEKFDNVLNSYDDNTYTSQTRTYAFQSTYDDRSYGFNLSSFISTDILPLTKIIFLYKRDEHKEQGNIGLPFKSYEAEILTAGIEEEFYLLNDFKTVIGISYDRMDPVFAEGAPLRSSSSFFNGNIGLNYNLTDNINLYANASRKSRFPTLKEFYSELLGSYEANPDLTSEQSYNYELGAATEVSEINISAALFYNNVNDLIQIVTLGDNVRQYQNINKADLMGFEFDIRYNFSFLNSTLNYTFLSAQNAEDESELPNRPAHVINFLLGKAYNSGFKWNTEASFISKLYSYDSDSGDLKRQRDYLLVNAKIAYSLFTNYSVYFRINNITDKLYETEYGFPQPGREYFVGFMAEW
jgi:iron complex outermembrane receptor protein